MRTLNPAGQRMNQSSPACCSSKTTDSAFSRHERQRQPLYLLRSVSSVAALTFTSLHQQPCKPISHANASPHAGHCCGRFMTGKTLVSTLDQFIRLLQRQFLEVEQLELQPNLSSARVSRLAICI